MGAEDPVSPNERSGGGGRRRTSSLLETRDCGGSGGRQAFSTSGGGGVNQVHPGLPRRVLIAQMSEVLEVWRAPSFPVVRNE